MTRKEVLEKAAKLHAAGIQEMTREEIRRHLFQPPAAGAQEMTREEIRADAAARYQKIAAEAWHNPLKPRAAIAREFDVPTNLVVRACRAAGVPTVAQARRAKAEAILRDEPDITVADMARRLRCTWPTAATAMGSIVRLQVRWAWGGDTVSLPPVMAQRLERLARKRGLSMAIVARDLLVMALDEKENVK